VTVSYSYDMVQVFSEAVACLELWRYLGTCTLSYYNGNTATDFDVVTVAKIVFMPGY